MATVAEILNAALRKAGAFAPDDLPTPGQTADALGCLNRMLYAWSTERNGIHAVTEESFSLVSSQSSYTMGTGGDFSTARPVRILEAWVRDANDLDYPVKIIDGAWYAKIGLKNLTWPRPTDLQVEYTYPLATLRFYPVPTGETVFLRSWKPLAQYAAATDDLNLPPEYEMALEFNLAVVIGPEYGSVPPEVAAMAAQTKQNLKTLHSQPVAQVTTTPFGGRSDFNIYRGY